MYKKSNSEQIIVEKKGSGSGNLLLIRSGRKKPLCLDKWCENDQITILISAYEEIEYDPPINSWIIYGGLSKFHAAKKIFAMFPELDSHEFFGFFDPDVEINQDAINSLFAMGKRLKKDIYQASLTKNSYTQWQFLKSHPKSPDWVETSFVEVMAPIFSKRALDKCLPSFDASISSWGLEYLWYKECKFMSMGFFNKISMIHATKMDSTDGPFYKYLKGIGINPQDEHDFLREKVSFYTPCYVPKVIPIVLKPAYIFMTSLIRKSKRTTT